MKAGSMGGLIGASINMEISKTPMRVYKEAERRGDTAIMERAMGYVIDFQEKAKECSDRAQEELAKELKEERKEQEIKREQAIEKRKDEQKEYERKIQESNFQKEELVSIEESTDVKLYTDEGKPIQVEQTSVSIDIKVGHLQESQIIY